MMVTSCPADYVSVRHADQGKIIAPTTSSHCDSFMLVASILVRIGFIALTS